MHNMAHSLQTKSKHMLEQKATRKKPNKIQFIRIDKKQTAKRDRKVQ